MLRLNTITKKNLLIALATGAISFSLVFWDKLKGKIRDLKGEVEELEEIVIEEEIIELDIKIILI